MLKTAVFLLAFCCSVLLAAADSVTVSNSRAGIDCRGGKIHLLGSDGRQLLKVGPLRFAWSPQVAVPAEAEKVNDHAIRVNYRMEKDDTGKTAVAGLFTLDGDKIRIDYDIAAPEGVKTGGIMQDLIPVGGTKKQDIFKSGLWTRAANGGVPYEVRDEYMKEFKGKTQSLWLLVRGSHTWTGEWAEHLPVEPVGAGKFKGETVFLAMPPEAAGFEAAAVNSARPLALRFSSDRDFNLWETGTPELKLEVSDTSGKPLSGVRLNVFAYDYDGRKVLDRSEELAFTPGERKSFACNLPADARNIYFLEASLTLDGKEYFTRTNAALLPPHRYEHPDKSNLGIAAFFNEPSREAVFRLMRRIGVHYLRSGDSREAAKYGMLAFTHSNVSGKQPYDPAKDAAKLQKMIEKYGKQQNIGWEFCNEWNFGKKGEERERSAGVYASWVRAIRGAPGGDKLNLISLGLAGGDSEYLKAIAKNGVWPLLDGVALHPGRGNMTPDCLGNGWFYLGSIRNIRKTMDELGGDKPLYLTEVYACTQPNNWWVDSYRLAAENTLLTFLLGVAEHAKAVEFYQMHNGIWADVNGVNPKDREYDFGLLMRDNSPKPSVLAFAAAAEALDGAEFVRYVSIPGTKIHGIEFQTPRGKMAVLYDRTDGYFFSKNTPDFVHKEPWVKAWKSETPHLFKSSKAEVAVVDPIGREKTLPVKNGEVSLILSGSPLIVYGLDL